MSNIAQQLDAVYGDKLSGSAAAPRKLLDHHRAALHARGLTDKTIQSAGLYSETSPVALAIKLNVRKPWKHIAPSLVIPFVGLDGRNGYERVRPDTPRQSKGKPVKYESPRNQPNSVYFPAAVRDVADDPSVDLIVTEGEFKSLAGTQAGFATIGLIGVYGAKQKGREALSPEMERVAWKGRRVFVAYDSDLERNEQVQLAESKTAKNLADAGAIVKCLRIPDGPPSDDGQPTKQGLDDFLAAHGENGPTELARLIAEAVEPESLDAAELLAPASEIEPAAFVGAYLKQHETDGLPHLRYWRGGPYLWSNGRYLEIESADVRAELIRRANRNYCYLTTGHVGNLMAQVQAQAALSSRTAPPKWLGDKPGEWPAKEVIATKSSIIHMPSLVYGADKFSIPATPRLFTTNALDFDFAIDAPPPITWLEFLDQLWGEDPESIQSLQEWFGYFLSCDTSQQKILLLIGPPRAGKGVIARVLARLIGRENACGPTLASLEGQFGLEPLLDKSLAIIADARLGGRVDQSKVVERLLSISGEDELTVDRKHRHGVTGRLGVRIMVVSNELPRLNETSGALSNRMVVLRLTESFLGKEDTALTKKLLTELPGILLWGCAGWRRLQDRGHFLQPSSSREVAEEMADLSSPIRIFVRERCVLGATYRVSVDDAYSSWCDWCRGAGREHPGTIQTFGRDLRAAVPAIRSGQARDDGSRIRVYGGIGLRGQVNF